MVTNMGAALVVIFILLLVFLKWAFFIVVVEGNSMQPTFVEGQRILAFRLWPQKWLRRGQVVITRIGNTSWLMENNIKVESNGFYIKRVIGLSGDKILSRLKDLPYNYRTNVAKFFDQDGNRFWKIPPGHYFIKSDYGGLDSTVTGPIPLNAFMALVVGNLPQKRQKKLMSNG